MTQYSLCVLATGSHLVLPLSGGWTAGWRLIAPGEGQLSFLLDRC